MKRIITMVTAAGAAALMLFSGSAQAHDRFDEGRYDDGYSRRADQHERHERNERYQHEWRELQRERQAFYARWDGNPWRRARFERWYARRCAELRYRG